MIKANLKTIIGKIELDEKETAALEWLSAQDAEIVEGMLSFIKKLKNRGAGRKSTVNTEMIKVFKAEGKTQEWIAYQMGISVATVRRNWKSK